MKTLVNLGLRIFANQKILEKPQFWVGIILSTQSPLYKLMLGTIGQKLRKNRCQRLFVLSNLIKSQTESQKNV